MTFLKTKVEVFLPIRPRNLYDPSVDINKLLSNVLFIYSSKLNGFPICYSILGISSSGKILEDGKVYINCLIEFCIIKVVENLKMSCNDGYILGTIPVFIEDLEEEKRNSFTGDFFVKNSDNSKIIGISTAEPEDSDF